LTIFSYFQLAGLAFFILIVAQRAISLRLRRRINPIRLKLSREGARNLAEIILLLMVNVWAIEVVFHSIRRPWRVFPYPFTLIIFRTLPTQWLGVILTLIGFAMFVAAMLALGASWRLGIDEASPGELVTGGIYAFSRNPIYLFFDLYFIGAFLINGTLTFLLFAVAVIALLHYQILEEERFLARHFGPAYAAYQARVARYVTLRPAWNWLLARRRPLATE